MIQSYRFAVVLLCAIIAMSNACQKKGIPSGSDPAWKKLGFSIKQLDADGLYGPVNAKVSMQYEFCIPDDAKHKKHIERLDPTVQFQKSRGRVGCKKDQLLCIGNTHDKTYQTRLYNLCLLPYVESIQQTFWE